MLAQSIRALLLLGAAGALAACVASSPDLPQPGARTPEIQASQWHNHDGAAPSIAGLQGRPILLEFFATW